MSAISASRRNDEGATVNIRRLMVVAIAAAASVWPLPLASREAESPAVSLTTEYLGRFKIAADPPQRLGPSVTYPVTNCTLQGPKIKATCVARVSLVRNGATRLDVRATLKTEDGELVFMEGGLIILNNDALDRYERGETLMPKEGSGVGAPRFTTMSKTYGWLNDVQTVAKMASGSSGGMVCDLFVVR
jgi:hypothetical protein